MSAYLVQLVGAQESACADNNLSAAVPGLQGSLDMHGLLDTLRSAGMKNPLDRVRVPRHNPRNVEGRTGAYQYFLKVCAVCVGVSHMCKPQNYRLHMPSS